MASEHNDKNEYNKEMPVKCAVIPGSGGGGYPNPKPNTATKKMRGYGAATKGIHYSKNSD
jgi:hypothetical protein